MSFSVRPTLRPVNWSEVDSHGKNIRQMERARSESPYYGQPTSSHPRSHYSPDSDMELDHDREPSASTSSVPHTPVVSTPGPPHARAAPTHAVASTSATAYPSRRRTVSFNTPITYYPPSLSPSEMMWRDRYGYLFQKGYQVRPRYAPTWNPMSRGNSKHYYSGEDHIMQILPQVLDGIRRKDGLVVCIKMISEQKKLKQIAIVQHFSRKPRLASDSRNHVVPFYDAFPDAFYKNIEYMVTPVLRRFDDPPFAIACEVVDFVTQMLEGLVFMHENNVAHHNIIPDHIMMDAKSLIPTGWHFVSHSTEPDGMTRIRPLDRKNHPVRYYYVGFGKCYHIQPRPSDAAMSPSSPSSSTTAAGGGRGSMSPTVTKAKTDEKGKGKMPAQAQVQAHGQVQGDGNSLLIMDIGGDDVDVPELFTGKPYDPYKMDVYTLGNVFLKEFYQKFGNLGFLSDLIEFMRTPSFETRPSAQKVLKKWYHIRETLDEDVLEDEMLVYRPGKKPKPFSMGSPDAAGAGAGAGPSVSASAGPSGSAGASASASASASGVASASASGSRSASGSGSGSRSGSRRTSSASTSRGTTSNSNVASGSGSRPAGQPAPATSSRFNLTSVGQLIPVREVGPSGPVPIPIYYFNPPPPQQQSGSGGAGGSGSGAGAGPSSGFGRGTSASSPPLGPVPRMGSGPAPIASGSGSGSSSGGSAAPNAVGTLIPVRDLGPHQPLSIPISYLPPPPPIPLYRQMHTMHPYPQPYFQPYGQTPYPQPVNVNLQAGGLGRGRGVVSIGVGGVSGASTAVAASVAAGASPGAGGGGGGASPSPSPSGSGERPVERNRDMDMDVDGDEREMSAEPFRERQSRQPQLRSIRPKNVRLAPGSWQ